MVIKHDFRHRPLDGDLLLTMACPVGCSFCVYSCMPSIEPQKWMPEETIRRVAEEYFKNNINVRICGGEPFYNLKKLERCIEILLDYYKPFDLLIITSAIFARTKENTIRNLEVLKNASFDTLVVSVDRFHLPRIPLTHIINVLEISKKMEIETVLRISLDSMSLPLIDELTKIIPTYRCQIEVHSWGIVGRGEKIDPTPRKDYESATDYFYSKLTENAKKIKAPSDPRYYLTITSKRSQDNFCGEFFPTTFPNGNVYGTSTTTVCEYMGNINQENLIDMIVKWSEKFPGFYILKKHFRYRHFHPFFPTETEDDLELFKSHTFTENIPYEANGRKFVKISMDMNFNEILEKLKKDKSLHGLYGIDDREFILSFRLTEKDLWNVETAKKIKTFLKRLNDEKIRFVLSRPLPKCLDIQIQNMPKDCFECKELFSGEHNFIKFKCCLDGEIGPPMWQIENRNQIYQYFLSKYNKLSPAKICKSCDFFSKGECNGLYFRKAE